MKWTGLFRKLTLGSIGSGGIIIIGFSKWLGQIWVNRIKEMEKASYNMQLEAKKQQLQIEFNKLSIIHEHQRLCFQNIIKELYIILRKIEKTNVRRWSPIQHQDFINLQQIISEESLLLGSDGEYAVKVFMQFLWRVIYFEDDLEPPQDMIRNVFRYLEVIYSKIRELFRIRLGISSSDDPVFDIKILLIFLLLNDFFTVNPNLPLNIQFDFNLNVSPDLIITNGKDNLTSLCSSLEEIVQYTESNPSLNSENIETLLELKKFLDVYSPQNG